MAELALIPIDDAPLLPNNLEAEAALIGAMMMDARCIDAASNLVCKDDFFEPLFGRLFEACCSMHFAGTRPNPIVLRPFFENNAAIKRLGGIGFLAELTASGGNVIGHRDFAKQIKELAERRRLIEGMQAVIADAWNSEEPMATLIASAESAVNGARSPENSVVVDNPADVAAQILSENGKHVEGVTTRVIPEANKALGKLRPSNFTVVAGRPGMGKSAFASSYAIGAAMNGHGTAFISLEMTKEQLVERMIADLCYDKTFHQGVPHWQIRDRCIPQNDDDAWQRIASAQKVLGEIPLKIIAASNLSVPRLIAMTRLLARQFEAKGNRLELVVVDYLQLMSGASKRQDNRVQEVSEITRGLKLLANEMGVAVLALSQLSRAVEARDDKRPRLSDLRESGSIEQDADTVGFLYRHEYYLDQAEPERGTNKHEQWMIEKGACANVVEIIAAKVRHGRTGVHEARFYGEYSAMRGKTGG